jgi:hypothetical protein
MRRFVEWVERPHTQVVFNAACTAAWLVMVPVTLLVTPLRTAILYVALMSVWANFATHLGALIAALVNVKAEAIHEHAEAIRDHVSQ